MAVLGRSDLLAKPWKQRRLGAILRWLCRHVPSILLERRRRRFGTHAPDVLHEGSAMLAQNALNASDCVAFTVKQMTDAAQQVDVVRPVIAAAAAAFHRLDVGETAFPKPQHVLRHVDFIGDFADGAERVRRLLHDHGPRAHDASAAPSPPELIRCLRMADGLNTMTRRGEIGTSLPVLGLRPIRWPFLRTTNEPNDDNFTVSPRSRQSVISLSTSSTSVADSVRDNPT